jgi:hypothetical protein
MRQWIKIVAVLSVASTAACSDWLFTNEAKEVVRETAFHHAIFTRFGQIRVNSGTKIACGTVFFKGDGRQSSAPETGFLFMYDPSIKQRWNAKTDSPEAKEGVVLEFRSPHFTDAQKNAWLSTCHRRLGAGVRDS